MYQKKDFNHVPTFPTQEVRQQKNAIVQFVKKITMSCGGVVSTFSFFDQEVSGLSPLGYKIVFVRECFNLPPPSPPPQMWDF